MKMRFDVVKAPLSGQQLQMHLADAVAAALMAVKSSFWLHSVYPTMTTNAFQKFVQV